MGQIRAFIAIELPEELKVSLARLQDKLKPGTEAVVKWVTPDGIHITLKFLGNVATDKVADITQAITGAVKGTKPFHLEAYGLGAFPNLKSPRVVWVGLRGNIQSLTNLQRQIDQALLPLGFPTEARGFSPHLTLGRVRDRATPQERSHLGEAISSLELESRSPFLVDKINFMRSTLTSSGAIYDRLASISLDRDCSK